MIWPVFITLALAFAVLFLIIWRLVKRSEELREIIDGYKVSEEEGGEILGELKLAICGLAGEGLLTCRGSCPGHFGSKANALFKEGLCKYEEMVTASREGAS